MIAVAAWIGTPGVSSVTLNLIQDSLNLRPVPCDAIPAGVVAQVVREPRSGSFQTGVVGAHLAAVRSTERRVIAAVIIIPRTISHHASGCGHQHSSNQAADGQDFYTAHRQSPFVRVILNASTHLTYLDEHGAKR